MYVCTPTRQTFNRYLANTYSRVGRTDTSDHIRPVIVDYIVGTGNITCEMLIVYQLTDNFSLGVLDLYCYSTVLYVP